MTKYERTYLKPVWFCCNLFSPHQMLENNPISTYMGKPRNTRKYPKYPKYPEIPESKKDTRKYPIVYFDTPTLTKASVFLTVGILPETFLRDPVHNRRNRLSVDETKMYPFSCAWLWRHHQWHPKKMNKHGPQRTP